MNRQEFKQRMQSLKSYRENNPGKGYWDWRNSLPDNLKYTDDILYDMLGAYESGAQPVLGDDGLYHLPTRDPQTGKVLKSSIHPTYWKGLSVDSELGYKPYFIGNSTYTWNNKDGVFVPWQKIYTFQDGGEKGQNIVNGTRVNPYTGQPIATGQITPVLDLRTAADITPVGDALAINDAVQAVQNRDWLGATLAGLGVLPFIPRVTRNFQDQVERMFKQNARKKQVVEDFYDQRNNTYEDLIENEDAYRRAVNADRKTGSNYLGVYQQMLQNYNRDASMYNKDLSRIVFDPNLYNTNIKGQVDPNNLGTITINPRYYDIDELDQNFQQMNPGLVRHEMSHEVDERAGLNYTNTLSNPDNFVSDEKLKEMYPTTYKRLRKEVLNRGSEIKSYMNEFRDYLRSRGDYGLDETVNSFRRKLDEYGGQFPTLRKIFDSYKSKKRFIRDYNTVPIVSTGNNNNLV